MGAPNRKCPICGRDAEGALAERYKPFCSKHCADLDLGLWLNGAYGIPAREGEDDEAERPNDAPSSGTPD